MTTPKTLEERVTRLESQLALSIKERADLYMFHLGYRKARADIKENLGLNITAMEAEKGIDLQIKDE